MSFMLENIHSCSSLGGFLGGYCQVLSIPPKGTSLAGNTHFVTQVVKIGQEM